jgi:hypothetical protein
VATTINRRRLATAVGVLMALAFLAAMALSGQIRESGQLVRFVPAGVLRQTPTQVDRIELIAGTGRWVFTRAGGQWRAESRAHAVPRSLATHLDDSVKFLHVSAPIRVMPRSEWAEHGLREFGLEPPAYSIVLFQSGQRLLAADFGAPNPQKVLQYMRLQDGDELYVMSRFIGQEWEQALAEARR